MQTTAEVNCNPSGDWTPAHLEIFIAYAKYLRSEERRGRPKPAPEQYNVWVYEVRKENVGVRDLPAFSDDYTGPIPRKPVDRRDGNSASAEGSTAESFLTEYARGAMEIQRQQADFQNRAAMAMLNRNSRGGYSWRGRKGGNRFGGHGNAKRETDTYYGDAYEESEVGEKRGRRERSDSPDGRRVRRRSRSRSEVTEDGEIVRDDSGDVVMHDVGNGGALGPVAGPSGSSGSRASSGSSSSNTSSLKGKGKEIAKNDVALDGDGNPLPPLPDSDDEAELDEEKKKKN
ncbi:hypothetical protein C8R45DRAFT_931845 [Mycena sanguinolenta]|nr:hypothetical protein C8R45DRAFT_931845 [Mycena sanguinolenta]